MGDVRFAAGVTVGIAGDKRNFMASVLDQDIRSLLRKGTLGALGGQLDCPRDTLAMGF